MTAHPAFRALGGTAESVNWDRAFLTAGRRGKSCADLAQWLADLPVPCPGTARAVVCALRPAASAARAARDFARTTLYAWAMDHLADDVSVITSELVGNALRHGRSHGAEPSGQLPIHVSLMRGSSDVLCAVADRSTDLPVLKEPDDLAENGRGMHVIASLSGLWGWTPPDVDGKVVWAIVRSPRWHGEASAW